MRMPTMAGLGNAPRGSAVFGALLLAGCGVQPAGGVPCAPLEPEVTDEVLQDVIAAGRDSDDLYVVDAVEAEHRVYVADDGVLVRHRVTGSGSTADGDIHVVILTVEDDDEDFTLGMEWQGGALRMALAPGETEVRDFAALLEAGVLLAGEDPAAVGDMPAAFEREPVVEAHVGFDGGEHAVVVRPRDDWDYGDFQLFMGPLDALAEREVAEVLRARDGGSTTIAFDDGGDEAVLSLPYVDMAPGQPSLTIDGETRAGELLDVDDLGPAAFLCLAG